MHNMRHRGPDDSGQYFDGPVALGMVRLADYDPAGGHQPVFNEDGSVAVVFNGEIYNYRELMAELKQRGHRFQTASDTEVLVHLYEEYGEGLASGCGARLRWPSGMPASDAFCWPAIASARSRCTTPGLPAEDCSLPRN